MSPEWLQWAGWAAAFGCLGVFVKSWFDSRIAHDTARVQARQVEVEAEKVEVTERVADTGLFDTAMKHYRDLVDVLRKEIDEQRERHVAEMTEVHARLTNLELREQRCREDLAQLQQDVERIQAENYRLRQSHGY